MKIFYRLSCQRNKESFSQLPEEIKAILWTQSSKHVIKVKYIFFRKNLLNIKSQSQHLHSSIGFPVSSQSGSTDFEDLGGASSNTWRELLLTASRYDLLFSFFDPVSGTTSGFMLGSGLLTGLDIEFSEWIEGEEVTSGENL